MSEKSCKDCVHLIPRVEPYESTVIGYCDYPVPAWMRIGCGSGPYVTAITGEDCPVHRSRQDMAVAALEDKQ